MKNIIPLSSLSVGERGVITLVSAKSSIKRRLLDIGLIEGTKVSCAFKNPSGDPSAFLVRGTVIALRSEDSSRIFVSR